jgi:hypothetical protein
MQLEYSVDGPVPRERAHPIRRNQGIGQVLDFIEFRRPDSKIDDWMELRISFRWRAAFRLRLVPLFLRVREAHPHGGTIVREVRGGVGTGGMRPSSTQQAFLFEYIVETAIPRFDS